MGSRSLSLSLSLPLVYSNLSFFPLSLQARAHAHTNARTSKLMPPPLSGSLINLPVKEKDTGGDWGIHDIHPSVVPPCALGCGGAVGSSAREMWRLER